MRSAVAVFIACLALAGCQKSTKKVIAVVPKATSHLFWLSVQAGALAAGEEFGVQIEWNGAAAETEYPRQIQIVDSFISRHVDGIALALTPAFVAVLIGEANVSPGPLFLQGIASGVRHRVSREQGARVAIFDKNPTTGEAAAAGTPAAGAPAWSPMLADTPASASPSGL